MTKDSHSIVVKDFFNKSADLRDGWIKKNSYYHSQIQKLFKYLVPSGSKALEIGSGTGDLLNSLKPKYGVGIDISENQVHIAKKKYPNLKFIQQDVHNLRINEKFDYIILSDVIGNLEDIQKVFEELSKVSNEQTRIIISYYNFIWEPILLLAEKFGLKMKQPSQSWLSGRDIENIFELSNYEIVKKGSYLLIPVNFPIVSNFVNKYLARLPIINNLCLVQYFIARRKTFRDKDFTVSVVIPARNEEGNIEQIILRTPNLGRNTQLIFVEGGSQDNTYLEIARLLKKYKGIKQITLVNQGTGIGKGDAVRKGFKKARGQILMILDADMTVAPEELTKFYQALRNERGELIMGSRLIYPLEKDSMRLLNIIGNKLFSLVFSFLLDQPIKDTLCGTKVLFKSDYEKIARNRKYFGDFDPFGDFDLIFGASKLSLKIVEIPIRYKARTYGASNISRFKHGWMLLKMTLIGARKIKFI